MQQLELLWCYLHGRLGRARDVAARSVKTSNEAETHWIVGGREDDGYCGRRRLSNNCNRRTGRSNHGHLALDQIGDK